jgi:hypothetical protein
MLYLYIEELDTFEEYNSNEYNIYLNQLYTIINNNNQINNNNNQINNKNRFNKKRKLYEIYNNN